MCIIRRVSAQETFLILGGAGMIGAEVARYISRKLAPRRIIIASLFPDEVDKAIARFRAEFPAVDFAGFAGDVFLREEWNREGVTRADLLASEERRSDAYDDLFGDTDAAYGRSQLVRLILDERPDVIVDGINTATAISYQDIYAASVDARHALSRAAADPSTVDAAARSLDGLLLSQSVPQLIRHAVLIHRAMCEAGTRLYLKVGTTGTGGMGLNVPYTHSEDKPSVKLMSKTAVAFAHTGLLFLMARTQGGPVVKEVKPGAMVGYSDITKRQIREHGHAVSVFETRVAELGGDLTLREPESGYENLGPLEMAVVDTGENGVFTKGEFEAITHLRQMEFITPEEIAQSVVLEIRGSNTGYDLIAAVDSAVMNPTYRAGYLRHFALEEVSRLEHSMGRASVALGQLGPPELGKLLWEAHLLKVRYGRLSAVIEHDAETISAELFALVERDEGIRRTIASVGLPILTPDGRSLIRGPYVRIPEIPGVTTVTASPDHVNTWAAKGWVDLRPANMETWRTRFARLKHEAQAVRGRGSSAVTREAYLSEEISIGAVAGWIFNNEEGAYRIK